MTEERLNKEETSPPSAVVPIVDESVRLTSTIGQELAKLAEHLSTIRTQLNESKGIDDQVAGSDAAPELEAEGVTVADEGTYLRPDAPGGRLARAYFKALLNNDQRAASEMIAAEATDAEAIRHIYLNVFQPMLYEVGRLWRLGELSVADEHYLTASTQVIMSQLYEKIFEAPRAGRLLIATSVSSNLHEIGIRMVADFFELSGWDTLYLGANMPLDSIIDTVDKRQPHALAISATMENQVAEVKDVIAALRATPAARQLLFMVGGPPFQHNLMLWREIGADGTADNPEDAVRIAEALLKEREK